MDLDDKKLKDGRNFLQRDRKILCSNFGRIPNITIANINIDLKVKTSSSKSTHSASLEHFIHEKNYLIILNLREHLSKIKEVTFFY